jgi:DNA-directed RNA polymerase subunit alpha
MLRQLIYPNKIFWEEISPTYGRLVIEPLERGFGITVGNSLRRGNYYRPKRGAKDGSES